MHQRAHHVSINASERYVIIQCDDEIVMCEEIPDYCPVCEQAL